MFSTRWSARLPFLIIAGIFSGNAFGARPTFATDPVYLIDTWETEDGLPENSATAMVQSPDGYLWFGTFNGLVRFDGLNFKVFDPGNTPLLPSEGIVNLHLDRRGWLWVSTYRGLVVREGTQWRSFGANDGWRGDYVRTFSQRNNGDLLLTTFDGHVLEFSQGRLSQLPPPPGHAGVGYVGFADEAGQWWVAQQWFVGSFDGHGWRECAAVTNLYSQITGAGAARDGGLWLKAGPALHKVRQGEKVASRALPDRPGNPWSITEDSHGNVWIATFDQGLWRVAPSGETRQWTTANGLSYNGTRFVFEDHERNLWVGTSGGGLLRFTPRRFQGYGMESGLTERNVMSVSPDTTGGIWVATFAKGMFRWSSGSITNVPLPPELNTLDVVNSVLTDQAGRTWLGTWGQGIGVTDSRGFRRVPPTQTGGFNIFSLFEDSRGRIWAGGERETSIGEGDLFRVVGREAGKALAGVRCFAEDRNGAVWLSNLEGLFRCEGDQFFEVRAEGKPLRDVTCIKTDPDGAVWLGLLRGGLRCWRDGSSKQIELGIGQNRYGIHGLLEDDQGFFWMPSDRGVLRAARNDLLAAADGKPGRVDCLVLDRSDGLPSVECPGSRQPVCARDAEGQLWFATLKGLAMIDPSSLSLNRAPPPVHIESMVYHSPPATHHSSLVGPDTPVANEIETRLSSPFADRVILPAGSRRIEIRYTAASFTAPEKVRFQFKLEDRDSAWREIGGQRTVQFYELTPANYTFRVRAANNDGVWNETGATLAFAVQPWFWQTGWFRGATALILIAGGAGTAWWVSFSRQQRWRRRHERTRRHAAALVTLSTSPAVSSGSLQKAFQEITETAARAIGIQRVGIWLLNENGTELHCADSFDEATGTHQQGVVLQTRRYPRYFESLCCGRAIAAAEARRDPRTSEFATDYLAPLGISSMLDATVRLSGKVVGVVCHEHVGAARGWDGDEVAFASAVADQVAQAMLNAEREKATGALRESEERMNLAADAARLGLWVWDIPRDQIWITEEGRSLFGWTKSEPVNFERFLSTLHPDDRGPTRQAVSRSLEGRDDFEAEYRVVSVDGATHWIAVRGQVEFNGERKPVRMRGVSIDITARRQAEAELQRQRAELAHVARVSTMGELAASVAHELNQPLGAILSNAEAAEMFLRQDPPALQEVQEILADIRKDDERAGEVIRRMRSLLRKREMEMQSLDLNSVVEDVFQMLSGDAALRKSALAAELSPRLPAVRGDRVHLQQVLLNLTLNALEAMAKLPFAKRRLVVQTRRVTDDTVELSVTDSGPGIEPAILPHLFETFFTTKQNGMGMGLSISRKIIEAHHGRISAENLPAGGAKFRFTLPIAPEEKNS